jgi:hypothetical protein
MLTLTWIDITVWGPGRLGEAAENEHVKSAYEARGEELVPLGYMARW